NTVNLPGNLTPNRIRLQIGVFDDANGPAPAGGLIGWNSGSIVMTGLPENSRERRTPGRLQPFNTSSASNANGFPPPPTLFGPVPSQADFQMWTEIDATIQTQSPLWT